MVVNANAPGIQKLQLLCHDCDYFDSAGFLCFKYKISCLESITIDRRICSFQCWDIRINSKYISESTSTIEE